MARKEFIRGEDIKCEIFPAAGCATTGGAGQTVGFFKEEVLLQQALAITHNINIEDDRYFNSEAPTITGTANGGEARFTVPREQEMLIERVLMAAASVAGTAFAFDPANRYPLGFIANWTNPDSGAVEASWICIPGVCGIGDASWDDTQGKATREYAIRSPNIVEAYGLEATWKLHTPTGATTAFTVSTVGTVSDAYRSRFYVAALVGNPTGALSGNYYPAKSITIVPPSKISANVVSTITFSVAPPAGTNSVAILLLKTP